MAEVNFAQVATRTLSGVEALSVSVEVSLRGGIPSFSIVGLPEMAVRESRDRVRAAITNSVLDFPERKIIANMAPADLPKQGSRFDLPLALAVLVANGYLPAERLKKYEFMGELSLSGELCSVNGALPVALAAARAGRALVLPRVNAEEAGLCGKCTVLPATSLLEVVEALRSVGGLEACIPPFKSTAVFCADELVSADLADVKGQMLARRALEIAAAGGHNVLMTGPPGTGKSMLASRLPGILPPMSLEQATESASVASISTSGLDVSQWRSRPFRSPHHTASGVALVGGGSQPRPGEISLAHNGVLFLDELSEFPRSVLDVLRGPMESGTVTIARAGRSAEFPARFQLIAAMNPCPCGHEGDPDINCRCRPDQVLRYQSRVSGPFLDRIDLHVGVPRMDVTELREAQTGENSETVRARVIDAYMLQWQRQACNNASLSGTLLEIHCKLIEADTKMLERVSRKLHLSLRAHHRLLRVARTIADLEKSEKIKTKHLMEAIAYRQVLRVRV